MHPWDAVLLPALGVSWLQRGCSCKTPRSRGDAQGCAEPPLVSLSPGATSMLGWNLAPSATAGTRSRRQTPASPSATWSARGRGATPAVGSTASPSTAWSWPRSPPGDVSRRHRCGSRLGPKMGEPLAVPAGASPGIPMLCKLGHGSREVV